jgi:NAD/NADP transhydrogenase beta subunit
MDKTGIIALIIGIVLCALGVYAIMAFLPQVITAVQGLIGIAVVCVGLMLVVFGILIIKD